MKLKELNLKHFGRFHCRRIRLSDGLNLITGENESGKSTVHTFIKSMLFGLRRQRGRAAHRDVYSRFEPRESPGCYAGELRFESGGKIFRLIRDFCGKQAEPELVCETDGERLSVEDGDLDVLLGGVSAGVYDNTVSIGQLQSEPDGSLAAGLKNYMANVQGSADGELDLRQAVEHLKKKRKEVENRLREKQEAAEAEKKVLSGRLEYARQEREALEESLRNAEIRLRSESPDRRTAPPESRKKSAKTAGNRQFRTAGAAAAFAAAALLAVSAALRPVVPAAAFALPAGVLLAAAAVLLFLLYGKSRKAETGFHGERPEEEEQKRYRWNVEYLRQELQSRRMAEQNLEQEYREYCLACSEKDSLETDLEGIRLALQTIEELSAERQKRAGAGLKKRMSEILFRITGGRYAAVSFDREMNMDLYTADSCVPLLQVSRGTVEQVYFSLRMAAAELLCGEEELPLILDEVFASYDDRRLEEALRWLAEQKRQVLLFSCTGREEKLLKRLGIPCHTIPLP
jgi:DNA repair exonuclease SbcCD ATPase subunit